MKKLARSRRRLKGIKKLNITRYLALVHVIERRKARAHTLETLGNLAWRELFKVLGRFPHTDFISHEHHGALLTSRTRPCLCFVL